MNIKQEDTLKTTLTLNMKDVVYAEAVNFMDTHPLIKFFYVKDGKLLTMNKQVTRLELEDAEDSLRDFIFLHIDSDTHLGINRHFIIDHTWNFSNLIVTTEYMHFFIPRNTYNVRVFNLPDGNPIATSYGIAKKRTYI